MRRDQRLRSLTSSCLAAAGVAATQFASAQYVSERMQPVFVALAAATVGAACWFPASSAVEHSKKIGT